MTPNKGLEVAIGGPRISALKDVIARLPKGESRLIIDEALTEFEEERASPGIAIKA